MRTAWLHLVAGPPSTIGMEATGHEWWRLVTLVIIFGVLFALWWWVNRGKVNLQSLLKAREQFIKVEEQRWLSSHLCIVLVQVGEERFLLAHNQHGISWQKLAPPSSTTLPSTKS